MVRRPPRSTLFPTRRSSDLARPRTHEPDARSTPRDLVGDLHPGHALVRRRLERGHQWRFPDRKSTRLNSSHTVISYAVFCLKKKKKKTLKSTSQTQAVYTST